MKNISVQNFMKFFQRHEIYEKIVLVVIFVALFCHITYLGKHLYHL